MDNLNHNKLKCQCKFALKNNLTKCINAHNLSNMEIQELLIKLNENLSDAKIAEYVGLCSASTITRARQGKRDVKSMVADKIREIAKKNGIK